MPKLNLKETVITTLYQCRHASAVHVTCLMHPRVVPVEYPSSSLNKECSEYTTVFRVLSELKDQRLIESHKFRMDPKIYNNSRTKEIFKLTELGMEWAKEILEIRIGHYGTGFQNDVGDFRYDSNNLQNLNHHLFSLDILICIKAMCYRNKWTFDFREARYCSIKYGKDKKKGVLRPDLHFRVNDIEFYLEVDLLTMRGDILKNKWRNYGFCYRYLFEHNKAEFKSLSKNILFVIPPKDYGGILRRWPSTKEKFLKDVEELSTMINLVFAPINHLQERVLELISNVKDNKHDELYEAIKLEESVNGLNKFDEDDYLYIETETPCFYLNDIQTRVFVQYLPPYQTLRFQKLQKTLSYVTTRYEEQRKILILFNDAWCEHDVNLDELMSNWQLHDIYWIGNLSRVIHYPSGTRRHLEPHEILKYIKNNVNIKHPSIPVYPVPIEDIDLNILEDE